MSVGPAGQNEPVNITKRLINSLRPPASGRVVLWDAQIKGFGLRIYPSGRISYVLQFRMRGEGASTRTATIGTHGSPWTPDAARERARDLLEQVRRGVDPTAVATERAEEEARAAAADLEAARYAFDAFVERYLDRHVRGEGLRSLRDIEGTFERDILPWFRGRSVLDVTKQDVQAMRAHVGKRSRSAANKAHKWLNAAFMWGVEHDGLPTSPMIALKKPFREPRRSRALADWEIALVWSVLDRLDDRFAMLERLLILTGQRLREVAGMRWEEIDLDKEEWIIPETRTKNKRQHLVPIAPQVRRLLLAIEPDAELRVGLVLSTNGRTPISGFSRSQAAIRAAVTAEAATGRWRRRGEVAPWVRHDHRRTFSTGCGELGVPLAHAEAALNHVSGTLSGVAGTYWLYQYAPEKRRALNRWAVRVEKVLTTHKIAFLP